MDDYIEETPEEREAGRRMMHETQAMVNALLAAETEEEQEAIFLSYIERRTSNDTTK